MKQCLEKLLFLHRYFGTCFRNGVLLLVGGALILSPAQATSKVFTIEIILSGHSEIYVGVADTLEKQLNTYCAKTPRTCPELQFNHNVLSESSEPFRVTESEPDLIITVGRQAAKSVDEHLTSVPVLHTLIPKASFEKLWLSPHTNRNSALFLEQPLQRQVNLARIITPDTASIGVILGPSNQQLASSLEQYLSGSNGQTFIVEEVNNRDEVGIKVRRILKESNVILALPDPTVYNRKTVPSILLSSYHNKVPVIGYSSSYVKAGALVAVFSTPEDIGIDTASMVKRFMLSEDSELPAPSFPKSFHVRINNSVARSLGLDIPSDKQLQKRLKELEEK